MCIPHTIVQRRQTVRYIDHIALEQDMSMHNALDPLVHLYDWYLVRVVGQSFVREQIRRMIAVLVAIARWCTRFAGPVYFW
jgi:tRNA U38,U39,U40 pseudouridine synthase TruA